MKIVLPEDLPRSLTCFEKSSEKYVGIIPLPKVNLKEIQKLWNEPEDEPMVDCYPLQTREQIEFFEKILRYKLKIEQYDYFLEIGKAQIKMENQSDQNQTLTPSKTLQQEYQEALLKTGIQAANLLTELIDLKIMPDPRAKEMADIALEVIKIINSAPGEIVKLNGRE